MVDFVEISQNPNWPFPPEPIWLDHDRLGPDSYVQDKLASDIVAGKQTDARDNVGDRYLKDQAARYLAMRDSVIWPVTSLERRDPIPMIAGVAAAFFVAPVFDPEVTSGAGVVFGYGVGIVTDYLLTNARLLLKVDKINAPKP